MPSKTNDYWEWGKLSSKSKDYINNSDSWINIAHGSVRSSKTITCSARWLKFIAESPHDEFLMSGKTSTTLDRNVLTNFKKMLRTEGISFHHNTYKNTLTVEDKTIWLMGFNDEGATDIVAGMTVGGWFADEITRNPKSTVEMAISRCSLPGAKMFWNTNPDSPYHHLYINYINNTELINSGTVKVWKFLLEDNPNLPKEYVEQLIKVNQKNPIFYKRNILGEWVIAEGAIYDMFIESENTLEKRRPQNYNEINICCDYGVSTVTVFGAMGIIKNPNGNSYHLLDEDYYDAEVKGVAQTDSERCETIIRLQNKYGLTKKNTLFLPHDAASLKAEAMKNRNIRMKIRTYTPDTYGAIETIQNLIAEKRFKIFKTCKESITQAQTYCWDLKASQKGQDRPLKINDHCPDMWRGGILGPRKTGRKVIV